MTVFQAPFVFLTLLVCVAGCTESTEPAALNLEMTGDAGVDAGDAAPDTMEENVEEFRGCGPG